MKNQEVLRVLPSRWQLENELRNLDWEQVQEVRLRVGQPIRLIYKGEELLVGRNLEPTTKADIGEMMEYVSRYSLYAYEDELRQGYITIEGGHRVGVVGKAVIEGHSVKNLKYISAINLRVSHQIKGCGSQWLPYLYEKDRLCNTLIISPPRGGKTTLLRDLVRLISKSGSDHYISAVGVVDERSEIAGCFEGVPQHDLGPRTDVLDACPKAEGMLMLIRSMSPQVIAVDEIGGIADVEAMEYALHCGCTMIATIHGHSLDEIKNKEVLQSLICSSGFNRFLVLGSGDSMGRVQGIYDGEFWKIY